MTVTSAARTKRLFAAATATATGVAMMALAPPASAAPGDLVLASTSDTGTKSNGFNFDPSLSADGATVAFYSTASNLDPADTDTNFDVYVKDLVSGDIVLAATSDTGVKSNGFNGESVLSADGNTVAFYSDATNLDPDDTDPNYDVYVKDLVSGDIVLAPTSDTGAKSNGSNYAPSLSADGNTVAFYSTATNLDPADTDFSPDAYVKDLVSGDIVLASTSDTGTKSNGDNFAPSLSADGNTVAFYSTATNLDPADTDTSEDVYVKDLVSGDIVLASTSDTGAKSNESNYFLSLSADGSKVAFSSYATNLDPADTDTYGDVYVKDLVSGDIVLASTSDTGVKGNGESSQDLSLSFDGSKVAFSSYATNLDPADTDFSPDAYVKDLVSGDIVLASTSDTGTKSNGYNYAPSLSADGSKVAFYSAATNLDPADTDPKYDVYVKDLTDPVTVAITNRRNFEGDTGRTRFVFRVTLSAPSPTPVIVNFATADFTAVSGSDYRPRSGTVTFASGETTRRVRVHVLGDTVVEPNETFVVDLSNPSGATIADGQGAGWIRNDD